MGKNTSQEVVSDPSLLELTNYFKLGATLEDVCLILDIQPAAIHRTISAYTHMSTKDYIRKCHLRINMRVRDSLLKQAMNGEFRATEKWLQFYDGAMIEEKRRELELKDREVQIKEQELDKGIHSRITIINDIE